MLSWEWEAFDCTQIEILYRLVQWQNWTRTVCVIETKDFLKEKPKYYRSKDMSG